MSNIVSEDNIKMELVETIDVSAENPESSITKVQNYSNGFYEAEIRFYKIENRPYPEILVRTKKMSDRLDGEIVIPSIYPNQLNAIKNFIQNDDKTIESFKDVVDFEIQTTSYGGVSVPEAYKLINGFEVAIATVKELENLIADL